jgi:hypothetical protein
MHLSSTVILLCDSRTNRNRRRPGHYETCLARIRTHYLSDQASQPFSTHSHMKYSTAESESPFQNAQTKEKFRNEMETRR